MFKKLMKSIRRKLLKIDWFKRKVEVYRVEQKKRTAQTQLEPNHELWTGPQSEA